MTTTTAGTHPEDTPVPPDLLLRPATAADVPALTALARASDEAVTGEAGTTAEEVAELVAGPDNESWLAADPDGRTVGWAYLENAGRSWREDFSVYARPDRPDALSPLTGFLLERVAARAATWDLPRLVAQAGVLPQEEAYVAALRDNGFRFVHRHARMRRALDGTERAPRPPAGTVVRPVRPDDDEDVRRVHEMQQVAFRDAHDFVERSYETFREWLDTWASVPWDQWFVAEVDGVPAASLISSDQNASQNEGWVRSLAVLPAYRRRGLGRLLLATAFAAYAARGRATAGLGVDMANPTGACALYEAVGMSPVFEADVYEQEVTPAR